MKLSVKKGFLLILTGFLLIGGASNAQKIDTVSTFSITTYVDAY
jgi:hypothetical protein